MKRRICWPVPDAVCLEGGCIYCEDSPPRPYHVIRRNAEGRGLLKPFKAGFESGRRWTK